MLNYLDRPRMAQGGLAPVGALYRDGLVFFVVSRAPPGVRYCAVLTSRDGADRSRYVVVSLSLRGGCVTRPGSIARLYARHATNRARTFSIVSPRPRLMC